MPLEDLRAQLLRGQQAKTALAGREEDYEYNRGLRDSAQPQINSYGTVSPLSILANTMRKSRGRKGIREGAQARTDARAGVNSAALALPMYQAKLAADKVTQDQTNFDTTASALTKAARIKAGALAKQEQIKAEALTTAAGLKADAEAAGSKRSKVYVMPDGTDPISVDETPKGPVNSFTRKPVDINGRITHEHYSKQTSATKPRGGKAGVDPLSKVGKPNLVIDILDSPDLPAASGLLDPDSFLGQWGYDRADLGIGDDSLEGERIQGLQSKMGQVTLDSVKTNLEGLGINPTDKDLAIALGPLPDRYTQPYARAVWTRDQYLPMLQKEGAKAVAQGTISAETLASEIARVEASVGRAVGTYGPQAGGGVIPNAPAPAADPYAGFSSKVISP